MENLNYNRIKSVLAEKGKSSKDLYTALGVSKFTVSKWVRNEVQPPLVKLYLIAEFLGVPVCDLLNDPPTEDG